MVTAAVERALDQALNRASTRLHDHGPGVLSLRALAADLAGTLRESGHAGSGHTGAADTTTDTTTGSVQP